SNLVVPDMKAQHEGSIIFISSIGGLKSSTVIAMYGVTKAADIALCRSLAAEWGPDGVRVNCIAPGLVETDFARVLYEDPERRAAWGEAAPAPERDWVAATGFNGEGGKLALVPDAEGRLGRVLVGLPEGEAAMWAFAGLSDLLPEGSYRIAALPEGGDPTRIAL